MFLPCNNIVYDELPSALREPQYKEALPQNYRVAELFLEMCVCLSFFTASGQEKRVLFVLCI